MTAIINPCIDDVFTSLDLARFVGRTIEDMLETECSFEGTVAELLNDEMDIPTCELRDQFGDLPLLDVVVLIGVDMVLAHRGWGECPDEYDREGSVSLSRGTRCLLAETFGEDIPDVTKVLVRLVQP